MTSPRQYTSELQDAVQRYQTGEEDLGSALGRVGNITLQAFVDEYVENHYDHKHKAIVTAAFAAPVFQAALETLARHITGERDGDPQELLLDEIIRHTKELTDKKLQPVRDFLANVGITI